MKAFCLVCQAPVRHAANEVSFKDTRGVFSGNWCGSARCLLNLASQFYDGKWLKKEKRK